LYCYLVLPDVGTHKEAFNRCNDLDSQLPVPKSLEDAEQGCQKTQNKKNLNFQKKIKIFKKNTKFSKKTQNFQKKNSKFSKRTQNFQKEHKIFKKKT